MTYYIPHIVLFILAITYLVHGFCHFYDFDEPRKYMKERLGWNYGWYFYKIPFGMHILYACSVVLWIILLTR